MPENRTYQGHTYTRQGPGEPWQRVGPAQGAAQPGPITIGQPDPYRASEEQRREQDQAFEAERIRIAQQNAAVTAANANKPPEGFEQTADGLRFIPGGPADPAVVAAERAAAAQATNAAKAATPDMDRPAQILSALENIQQLRELADQTLAVGKTSEWASGLPLVGPLLGQNRADVEGALQMVQGDLIQQQIARLSAINGGNGVASIANSESEAARMAASIANLDPNQNPEQFQIGLTRAEAYYRRQLEAMKAQSGVPEPLRAAGAGATEQGLPIPAAMQAEHMAYLRENWGNLTPEGYAAFREGLDRKYEFEPNLEAYRNVAEPLNQRAAQGGTPDNALIPPVTVPLDEVDQVRNDFLSTATGRGVTAFANAAGAGIPGLIDPDRMNLMREESNGEMFAGDMLGGLTGAKGVGLALGGAAKLASASPRVAALLANPMTAEATYGGVYGGLESGGLGGAATGVVSALLGDVAGKKIGQAVGGRLAPEDALSGGERAVYGSVAETNPVAAALTQAGDLGVPMTLADASPELASLAGSATRFSPTVAGDARAIMARRNQGQYGRLTGAIERDLGPVTNIPQRSEDLLQQARTNAGPLYRDAYAAPGAETIQLDDLADRPTFAAALREGYTEMLDEGLDPSAVGLQGVGDDIVIASPSWQALDYTKRGLDNIIERGIKQGDAPAVRRATAMKNLLLTRMDEVNPTYAEARRAYAGPAAERSMLEEGRNIFRDDAEQIGVDMAGLSPEQAEQVRLGAQSGLRREAGNVRNNLNPWSRLNDPEREMQLGNIYEGAEGSNIARLLSQRDLELQLAGSANRLIGNSATAERSVADEFFKQQPGIGGDVAQGVAETALLGGPFLTVGKRIGDRLFRDRREAAAMQANRTLADELGPILLDEDTVATLARLADINTRGAEHDAVLKALMETSGQQGARIGSTTGSVANARLWD